MTTDPFQDVIKEDEWSLGMWVKLDEGQPANTQGFFSTYQAPTPGGLGDYVYGALLPTGHIKFEYKVGDKTIWNTSEGNFQFTSGPQPWTFIVFRMGHSTAVGAQTTLFLDGDPVTGPGQSGFDKIWSPENYTSSQDLIIGALSADNNVVYGALPCKIEEVYITDDDLNHASIQYLYTYTGNPSDGPSCPKPSTHNSLYSSAGWWRMGTDGVSYGNTITDIAAGNHGVLTDSLVFSSDTARGICT
jgi:hypothetical protein